MPRPRSSCSPSSGAAWSHELPSAVRAGVLRAVGAAGPALLPQGAAARADGVQPAPVAYLGARPRGLHLLPAAPPRPADAPAAARTSGAGARAGPAGRDGHGAG